MIVEMGKHKGKEISQLSIEELKEMSKGMLFYYQKLTTQISFVNDEISRRQKQQQEKSRPTKVSEASFKLDEGLCP